jgi:hypothetical protein
MEHLLLEITQLQHFIEYFFKLIAQQDSVISGLKNVIAHLR